MRRKERNHTPRDWVRDGNRIIGRAHRGPETEIAVLTGKRDGKAILKAERETNARLIEGAPMLLELCREALDYLEQHLPETDPICQKLVAEIGRIEMGN